MLADSSKAGTRHLVAFATTAEIDTLVTDEGLPAELAAELEEAGIEVLTA
jgi:DeoR family fructose operon transcriptional repressor